MSAEILNYWDYDSRRDAPITCRACGWSGLPREYEEMHRDLLDVCCPECDAMVLIVMFPTLDETREAAEGGNPKAVDSLVEMESQFAALEGMTESLLQGPEQLPDLDGDHLIVIWDLVTVDDKEWTVLRCGDRELFRERTFWEGYPRFEEVAEILRARYGKRLFGFKPTSASEMWLYGDSWTAIERVAKVDADLRAQS